MRNKIEKSNLSGEVQKYLSKHNRVICSWNASPRVPNGNSKIVDYSFHLIGLNIRGKYTHRFFQALSEEEIKLQGSSPLEIGFFRTIGFYTEPNDKKKFVIRPPKEDYEDEHIRSCQSQIVC